MPRNISISKARISWYDMTSLDYVLLISFLNQMRNPHINFYSLMIVLNIHNT